MEKERTRYRTGRIAISFELLNKIKIMAARMSTKNRTVTISELTDTAIKDFLDKNNGK